MPSSSSTQSIFTLSAPVSAVFESEPFSSHKELWCHEKTRLRQKCRARLRLHPAPPNSRHRVLRDSRRKARSPSRRVRGRRTSRRPNRCPGESLLERRQEQLSLGSAKRRDRGQKLDLASGCRAFPRRLGRGDSTPLCGAGARCATALWWRDEARSRRSTTEFSTPTGRAHQTSDWSFVRSTLRRRSPSRSATSFRSSRRAAIASGWEKVGVGSGCQRR